MYKKRLDWKSFEAHEDQAAYGRQRFLELTPGQRIERFFGILEIRLALLNRPLKEITSKNILRHPCSPGKS